MVERADAARNRRLILDAAAELLDAADAPAAVTIDAVAAAAGVGKGTVFRRFGDRTGLLHALLRNRAAGLAAAILDGPASLGPGTEAARRVPAIIDAIVRFKLANRQLMHAIEIGDRTDPRTAFLQSPEYRWAHELLVDLLRKLPELGAPSATAHILLAFTRVDFLDQLSAEPGMDEEHLTAWIQEQVAQLLRVVDSPGTVR